MQQLSYRRHRFPPLIIQHATWLYLRFTLSYRDVEELLAERGIDVSNETIRRWVLKFGRLYAQRRGRNPMIDGIWMRCSFRSAASGCICGVPWTVKVMFWTS